MKENLKIALSVFILFTILGYFTWLDTKSRKLDGIYTIGLDWRNKVKYHDSCLYYWGQYQSWRSFEIWQAAENDSINERRAVDMMQVTWKKYSVYKDSFSTY